MRYTVLPSLFILLHLFLPGLCIVPGTVLAKHSALAEGKKILVVVSYHREYRWCEDILETLEQELAGAELTVFYMDTKKNLAGAAEKAREAFSLYNDLQPDAVIAIDDNAQAYFVVPYLKDKVKTPVIFCGVNDEADRYGFPATNVTGVLEKKHYRESISFARIIEPKIRAVGVFYRPSPSNSINLAQIEKEKGSYPADIVITVAVESVQEVEEALRDNAASVDALILLDMTGIRNESGEQMEGHEAIALITEATDLVTIGASDWEVEAGALCGVIKSGREQGTLAARQLMSLLEGREISDLPILENRSGQRYINLNTFDKLNVKLRPEVVIGTRIITGR